MSILNFRGIRGSLDVSFAGRDGCPASVAILGDNGSGKSSVVDALEFALQGRLLRSRAFTSPSNPSIINLSSGSEANVQVELEDGTVVKRRAWRNSNEEFQYVGGAHPAFDLSPLVLRRLDVLQFWDTPDEQKQVLFFGYFKGQGTSGVIDEPVKIQLEAAQTRRLAAKERRRVAIAELARLCGRSPDEVPLDGPQFSAWVTDVVYRGVGKDKRDRLFMRGTPVRIPHKQHQALKRIQELSAELTKANREVDSIKSLHKGKIVPGFRYATQSALEQIGADMTAWFKAISPSAAYVDEIDVHLGKTSEVSLEITVRLVNGVQVAPKRVFSEANLDLLALLVFFAVAREAASRGQAKVLVLDDVFQSVDAGMRLRAVEFLLSEFKGWQLLFTVHDRLWKEQLSECLRRVGHSTVNYEITRWSFDEGPRITCDDRVINTGLSSAMASGQPYQICAEAGLLLEQVSQALSYSLPVSIIRRKGDRYTLGDLWPGVLKQLKKTSIAAEADGVDRWLHLRNLLGAHFNEWARVLSRAEAEQLGRGALSLLNCTYCSECGRWIEQLRTASGTLGGWTCRCGQKKVTQV